MDKCWKKWTFLNILLSTVCSDGSSGKEISNSTLDSLTCYDKIELYMEKQHWFLAKIKEDKLLAVSVSLYRVWVWISGLQKTIEMLSE